MKPKKAIALGYEPGKDEAPIVLAAGTGAIADKILEAALEHGVPVQEDEILAEALSAIEVGEAIPEGLYAAVAEVLVFFQKINRERKRG
ncbi:MAG: EscU/YscU/HrcU family type III secretion system export apparatus switch protein [Bacteroidota bacterium]